MTIYVLKCGGCYDLAWDSHNLVATVEGVRYTPVEPLNDDQRAAIRRLKPVYYRASHSYCCLARAQVMRVSVAFAVYNVYRQTSTELTFKLKRCEEC